MKTAVIVTLLLSFILIGFLVLGIFTGPETVFQKFVTIEAPEAVVRNQLDAFGHYHDWCPFIRIHSYDDSAALRQTDYLITGKVISITENITVTSKPYHVSFSQQGPAKNSLIRNMRQEIELVSLPDGSTDVYWRVSYNLYHLFAQSANEAYIKRRFQQQTEQNLAALKTFIER